MMSIMLYALFLVLIGMPCIYAEQDVASITDSPICDPKCGCDGMYRYDGTQHKCVLNLEKLMKTVVVHYDNENSIDILAQNGMARSIYIEGEKAFRGIMVSVILVMSCATVCVLSACIYCCRIDYTDRKLKTEVKTLAKKMNKTYKKATNGSKTSEAKEQSCPVVVEEAGVFMV